MKTLVLSTLAAVMTVSTLIAVADTAAADEWHHHHHHNNGAAIAGGVVAGVIGGLLAGAAVNSGPRYIEAPPPRCWFENQPVQNQYDDGWHNERVRVCR